MNNMIGGFIDDMIGDGPSWISGALVGKAHLRSEQGVPESASESINFIMGISPRNGNWAKIP